MSGQLGHGEETDQRRPVLVQDLVRFRVSHIACGLSHTVSISPMHAMSGQDEPEQGVSVESLWFEIARSHASGV